jgi:hypothetical protein
VALLATSCSLVAVRGPPPGPLEPGSEVRCTASRALPALDGIAGATALGAGVAALIQAGRQETCRVGWDCLGQGIGQDLNLRVGTILVSTGAALGISALVGAGRVAACRDVRSLQRRCTEGDAAACSALVAPTGPHAPPWPGSLEAPPPASPGQR